MFFQFKDNPKKIKKKLLNRFCLNDSILDFSQMLLLSIYHVRVVSISQLHTTLFSDVSRPYLTLCINRLAKEDYIKSVKLPRIEGISRKVYIVTKKGADVIEQLTQLKQAGNEKPWNIKENSYFHIMGQAFAVLSTLNLPDKCSVAYEQVYRMGKVHTFHSEIKTKNSICVDTMFYYPKLAKTVYVEQDTGTEDISVLLKKINNYYIVPCFYEAKYSDAALFFAFNKHCYISQTVYESTLPLIHHAMGEMLKENPNCTVEEFYAYMVYWKSDHLSRPSYATKECFSKECMAAMLAVTLCIRNYLLNKAIEWLDVKENQYILFEALYCIQQQLFARNRMNSMKKVLLLTKYDTASIYFNALSQLYNGLHCYCIASGGINSLISEFLWDEQEYLKLACKIFPERANTGQFKPIYRTEIGNLCNCICYNDGFVISFEDIQYDLGGYLRCVRTAKALKRKRIKERICLCMVFDDRSVLYEVKDDSNNGICVNGTFNTNEAFLSCFLMFNGGFTSQGILDGEVMYIDNNGNPYKV